MKQKLLVLLLATGLIIISSCKKDENDSGSEKFSTLSVEENKEKVEGSAIKLANSVDDMKDMETIDVMETLSGLLSLSGSKKSNISSTIDAIASLGTDEGLNNFSGKLKSSAGLSSEPETAQEIWNECLGTYTWDSDIEDWEITDNSSQVLFKFPSTETGTSNNAELVVYGYNSVTISTPIEEEYDGDIPTSLKMDLKVDGTKLLSYVYSATFNNEGVPSAFAIELTIESFKIVYDLTNNTSDVSSNYKFTQGETVIFDIGVSAKGEFTKENVENNTDEDGDVMYEEIVNSASAHFRVFDIEIKGDMDLKKLGDQMRIDDSDSNAVIQLNKYVDLRLIDRAANAKIAEVEAYLNEETYEGGYTYSYLDFRFVFADESPVDMETYFTEGFDGFITEVNSIIADLNSEYDADLETIDY